MFMSALLKKKILYLGFTLFFGYLLLEIATRLLVPAIKIEPAVPRSVGTFDEQLGWGLKPNTEASSSRTGYPISYKINSRGLRDAETTLKKPTDIFRIVLIGDSRTFGFGVPIEKHFSTVLEGYFNNIEVINLGVGGYGVGQELLSLRLKGFQYEPGLIIAYVAHYDNQRHMHTTRWGKEKPRFVLNNGKLALENYPVQSTNRVPKSSLEKIHLRLIKHSRVYEIIDTAIRHTGKKKSNAISQSDQDNLRFNDKSFRDSMYNLGAEIVFSMNSESSEHGASFVLVTHIDELHQSAIEHGLLSMDVSEALANPIFLLPDKLSHINEAGNGVLAWEIATFLQENNLIPARHINPRDH